MGYDLCRWLLREQRGRMATLPWNWWQLSVEYAPWGGEGGDLNAAPPAAHGSRVAAGGEHGTYLAGSPLRNRLICGDAVVGATRGRRRYAACSQDPCRTIAGATARAQLLTSARSYNSSYCPLPPFPCSVSASRVKGEKSCEDPWQSYGEIACYTIGQKVVLLTTLTGPHEALAFEAPPRLTSHCRVKPHIVIGT